jgi:GNAT superfamily N-acetyltransferase
VFVCSVVVKHGEQGTGLSKKLVDAVVEKAREAGKVLAISETDPNNVMQHTLLKCGFTHLGTLPRGFQRSWTDEPPQDEMIFYKLL